MQQAEGSVSYVTGRWKRFRFPLILIMITSRVDLAMPVWPLWASYAAQVCITSVCHAHSNARIMLSQMRQLLGDTAFHHTCRLIFYTHTHGYLAFVIFIHATRRVKGCTRLVRKYATGRRKFSDPIKYIY